VRGMQVQRCWPGAVDALSPDEVQHELDRCAQLLRSCLDLGLHVTHEYNSTVLCTASNLFYRCGMLCCMLHPMDHCQRLQTCSTPEVLETLP
jgi:hypothetical protein